MTNTVKKLGLRRLKSKRSSNCLRRSSLFTLYAKIFRLLLTKFDKFGVDEEKDTAENEYGQALDTLVLPSNEDWRLRVYYTLVDLQREYGRESDGAEEDEDTEDDQMSEPQSSKRPHRREPTQGSSKGRSWGESRRTSDWDPDSSILYPLKPTPGKTYRAFDAGSVSAMLEQRAEPGWRLNDIILASKLLRNPPEVDNYNDEAEMRRVFGLVYDVLRYENVLERTLADVNFWQHHPELKDQQKIVWLLLYDMHGRKFARDTSNADKGMRRNSLQDTGLLEIEEALIGVKTKLAASFSRLRIRGSALNLDELLPSHLRTAEGVTWGDEGSIACGWVNTSKFPTRDQFSAEMSQLGFRHCKGCAEAELEEDQYVFDPLCPKVVNLHERAREKLATSDLVKLHGFIFMERSLCLGATALVQAMRTNKLCGPVILTHPLAPRHTAYVAELLMDVEDAGRLLVFGLGENRTHHQNYLDQLGVSVQRCKLFTEKFISPPPSTEIERATLVMAIPPCSYTGVRDLVDLAVARGGDLKLLESLTSVDAESPQHPRAVMAEQMNTLRYAMTRPNVQLILYEVHTILPSETTEMIEEAVNYANKMAIDKFQREHPPVKKKTGGSSKKKTKRTTSQETLAKSPYEELKSIVEASEDNASMLESQIPESDFFEIADINELYQMDCSKFLDRGTFIVMAKRKEMMQFNSLFMIKVAESKGVFGDPSKESAPVSVPEASTSMVPTTSTSTKKKSKKILIKKPRKPSAVPFVPVEIPKPDVSVKSSSVTKVSKPVTSNTIVHGSSSVRKISKPVTSNPIVHESSSVRKISKPVTSNPIVHESSSVKNMPKAVVNKVVHETSSVPNISSPDVVEIENVKENENEEPKVKKEPIVINYSDFDHGDDKEIHSSDPVSDLASFGCEDRLKFFRSTKKVQDPIEKNKNQPLISKSFESLKLIEDMLKNTIGTTPDEPKTMIEIDEEPTEMEEPSEMEKPTEMEELPPIELLHDEEFNKKFEALKRDMCMSLDLNQLPELKIGGTFTDVAYQPSQNSKPIVVRRASRYQRMNLENNLETVVEQGSNTFSYVYSEEND